MGAGKAVGLELWRIEDLKPVKQGKANGKFHTGDSYILLSTSTSKSGKLVYAIHFWLGCESSQDETGIAAYKTVELDDSLGGGPSQYREVQESESALFLSYFKHSGGIEYLPGGIDSGFKKVERDVYETRLLHCKGKRTVRVKQVPLAASSLCKGDVFILDKGLTIWIFNGPTSNKYERVKAAEIAQHIKDDERGGRATVLQLHEDPTDADFWTELGGYLDPETLPEGDCDSVVDSKVVRKLFQISDESGSLLFDEISPSSKGQFNKSQLDSSDVFLLHSSSGKIYLWVGRGANLNEKKQATVYAVHYVKQHGLPFGTPIERVSEGSESAAFKSEFLVWDPPRSFGMMPKASTGGEGGAEESVDVSALLARKVVEDTPIDDGTGKLTVWSIKNFEKEPVPEAEHGHFHGGDSYILLYTYLRGRSEEHVIYFWLGGDSTPDEKGAAALLTVALDDSMGGKPVQVRVTQGKEPAHFRQLFAGKMIVFKGGHASGFSNSAAAEDVSDISLFHIKGTSTLNTCAVEVTPQAASLNSEDSFVLVTPESVYVWFGLGANQDEIAVATATAATLAKGREVVKVKEGEESDAFWVAMGGRAEYPSMSLGDMAPQDPRLFEASTATGSFKVEEVDNYDQSDLNDEDVYLLDTFTSLFVWVGTQSSQVEKDKAMEFAQRYVAESGREDIPIIRVGAGTEPGLFSCHFQGWDGEFLAKRKFVDPYLARSNSMKAQSEAARAKTDNRRMSLKKTPTKPAPESQEAEPLPEPPVVPPPVSLFAEAVAGSLTLAQLAEGAEVNPACKEAYLSDADFEQVFGMDRGAFDKQAKWKKDAAKKKAGLF